MRLYFQIFHVYNRYVLSSDLLVPILHFIENLFNNSFMGFRPVAMGLHEETNATQEQQAASCLLPLEIFLQLLVYSKDTFQKSAVHSFLLDTFSHLILTIVIT